jgi:hypothetical protein
MVFGRRAHRAGHSGAGPAIAGVAGLSGQRFAVASCEGMDHDGCRARPLPGPRASLDGLVLEPAAAGPARGFRAAIGQAGWRGVRDERRRQDRRMGESRGHRNLSTCHEPDIARRPADLMGIGSPPANQPPVPAQQRIGLHQPASAAVSGAAGPRLRAPPGPPSPASAWSTGAAAPRPPGQHQQLASFDAGEPASSTIQPVRRTNIRYSIRTITSPRSCQPQRPSPLAYSQAANYPPFWNPTGTRDWCGLPDCPAGHARATRARPDCVRGRQGDLRHQLLIKPPAQNPDAMLRALAVVTCSYLRASASLCIALGGWRWLKGATSTYVVPSGDGWFRRCETRDCLLVTTVGGLAAWSRRRGVRRGLGFVSHVISIVARAFMWRGQ